MSKIANTPFPLKPLPPPITMNDIIQEGLVRLLIKANKALASG